MTKSCWSLLLICVAFGIFFNSYEASAQKLTGVPKGTTSAPLGYYEYLPQGYSPTDSKKWPLIIFLHGVGEVGDGTSQLSIILRTGLPLLLQKGKSLPFVIIMPQANQQWWDPGQVDQMYEFVKTKYNIDQNRFYMTGLSLGGIGTWLYTMAYPQKVAAMVSCAGNSGGHTDICGMNNIPIWDFHGDADPTVAISGDITAINTINNVCHVSPRAKLTVYPGVTHNCWDRTYDGTGMGTESSSYDPFNMDIYTWFLQYSKNGTTPVNITANAGSNQTITLPTSSVTLYGSGSSTGGSVSYAWTKTSGGSATLAGQNTATLSVSGLTQGSYTFQLKVTDSAGNTATSLVTVTVNAAVVVTANAGANQTITLPTSSVTLYGSGSSTGGGVSYSWTKTSGGSATLAGQNTATLGASGLTQGAYTFQLKVTDTGGNSATSNVGVTVNAATAVSIKANAGSNQTITLPTNSVTLYGSGTSTAGSIASYLWTKASGGSAAFTGQNTATLSVTGLLQGSYVFQLKITDTAGNTATSLVGVTVNPAVVVTPPPTGNLFAEWGLDGNTNDISGNNINGTPMGLTYSSDHAQGSASGVFNGTNEYVNINSSALPAGKSARSISLWAKPNSVSETVFRWAFAYGAPKTSSAMLVGQNGTTLYGGGFGDDLKVGSFWKANTWHHICLTYDGTTARLYGNGKLLVSGAKNWDLILTVAAIGRQVSGLEYWNGSIDDVRLYNKALSDTEVAALAVSSTAATATSAAVSVDASSALVGEWSFDNNTVDKTGHSPNGVLMAGTWYDTGHKEGTASVLLNGASQYVDLKNPAILPSGKSPRTMSLWAKTKDLSSSYRWCAAYGMPAASQAMFIGQNGTALIGGGFTDDLVVNNFWTFDTWHHIALTYDGTTAMLYADGKLVSSAAKNWNLVKAFAYVGRQVNNAEYWNGSVDDVRFYSKALTASEVQSLYQANAGTVARSATTEDVAATTTTPQPEEGASNFVIYPNPAQHSISLNIESDAVTEDEGATMIIQDMSGKQVKRVDGLTPESTPTDIDELSDGIYVATIVVQGKTVSRQRFIKANR